MTGGTNHWKLGLFVIIGIAVALAALVTLGAQRWNDKTVTYFSFFDESVQGLEVGSPVKFRGVTVGRVATIDVAPDRRHVQVENELFLEQLTRLGLDSIARGDSGSARPNLRVQMAQTGITGVKFIQLDFFDPKVYPLQPLPFKVPQNTLPVTASTMKNLEDSVVRTANQFPDIATALLGTVTKLNSLMDNVEQQRLPNRAGDTINEANAAMAELRGQLKAVNAAALSASAEKNLTELNRALTGVNRLLERLDDDRGLMESAEMAAKSMSEVARGAQAVGPELELTLREVRGAARSIRRFVDALERDPDMLLKGRAGPQ
jgi:ABC-type transporter Mla subunit MlaD